MTSLWTFLSTRPVQIIVLLLLLIVDFVPVEMTGDEDNAFTSCRSSPVTSSTCTPSRRHRGQRYKTELCRQFQETGTCCYGARCQFAHGLAELRSVARHPKYKTDLCRTFHTTGLCPYGPRCHFIHNDDDRGKPADRTLGLECLRAQSLTSTNFALEFELEHHLMGLILLAFDPTVMVPRQLPYPVHLLGSVLQPSTRHSVNALVDRCSSLTRSCGSVASSSQSTSHSTSFGDVLNWMLVE